MSACDAQNFNNVTPSVWECCKKAVAGFGITITTNSGTQSRDGYTVTWNYDPGAQTLSIQCLDSPTLVPCFAINSRIRDLVEPCLNG